MTKFLRFLNRDPGEEAGGGGAATEEKGVGESITDALENQEAGGELKPGDEGYVAPEDLIDIEGYKGANRRSKGYDGEKRRQADKDADNPSYEMSFEMEEGKGKHKLTLTELKETAAFLHNNRNSLAASLKIREMATKNPEFGKLIDNVIKGSHDGENGAYNSEFVTRMTTALDAKAEKIDDKIEDTDEDIKKIEDLLNSDDVDPDSVQAQVLKSNLATLKSFKTQLKASQKQVADLTDKFGKVETSHQTFLSDTQKADEEKEISRVSDIFKKEFGTITDSTRENGMKFVDDEDKADFEKKVRSIVASESGKENSTIKTDEDFVKLIRTTSDLVYKRISTIRESYVNDYLKNKNLTPNKDGDAQEETVVSVEDMEKQLALLEADETKKDSPEAEKLRAAIKLKKENPEEEKSIGQTIADAMFEDDKK